MNDFSSRSESRQERFYRRAENALFSSEEILYPSEVRKLKKEGFKVVYSRGFQGSLAVYDVIWNAPYENGIPHIVFSYTSGMIESFPHKFVNTFAEELYVIARKALCCKYSK